MPHGGGENPPSGESPTHQKRATNGQIGYITPAKLGSPTP